MWYKLPGFYAINIFTHMVCLHVGILYFLKYLGNLPIVQTTINLYKPNKNI